MTPPAPEKSMITGDRTERLLTSMSRFKRHVSRAEEGVPQEAWCDECIDQLIVGIEIALNEGWSNVQEALTDTARVLQTYEEASMAADCVPFLNDSHEILSLLVGDLLLDNVRSGVMTKWRARYARALDELQAAGLTLVEDDSAIEIESQREAEVDSENQAFDTPDPFATSHEGETVRAFDEGDAFDALLGDGEEAEEAAGHDRYGSSVLEVAEDPFAPVDDDESPFTSPSGLSGHDENQEGPAFDGLGLGDSALEAEDSSDMSLSNDFTADESDDDDEDEQSEMASPEVEETLFDGGGSLFDGSGDTAETVTTETDTAGSDPMQEEAWEDTSQELSPAPVEDAPAPVALAAPAPEPEPGSPEALWKTAQEAMSSGNVAGAKNFALQLAANMARLEADQVEARAAEIEARIQTNQDEVRAAEQSVSDAENRVRELESQFAQCQQDFEGKRQHVQQLREDVAAVEGRVGDLEAQIAALEAQRDEERKGLSERQSLLDDILTEESRMQAELDDLSEEEGGARENLESVRTRVGTLQDSGNAQKEELDAAREELRLRRASVLEIERTFGLPVSSAVESTEAEVHDQDDAASDESHEHDA